MMNTKDLNWTKWKTLPNPDVLRRENKKLFEDVLVEVGIENS